MSPTHCPLCQHTNPEQSKFCNACGAWLLAAPQALKVQHSAHREGAGLAKPDPVRPASPLPPAGSAMPLAHAPRRSHARLGAVQRGLIVGGAIVAAIASLSYLTYKQIMVVDVSGLLPAGNAGMARDAFERNDVEKAMPRVEEHTAASAPMNPGAPETTDDTPVAAPAADAVHLQHKRAKARSEEGAAQQHRPSVSTANSCTAAVAALGLCDLEATRTAKE